MNKTPIRIKVQKDGEEIEIAGRPGMSLLDNLINADIEIDHSCEGNASCGTCCLKVKSAARWQNRNELEREMAEDRGFAEEERLACQWDVDSDLTVEIS